ncbi:MAG TPA: ComEC/Rec2 family competence protein [Paludibacteraceae bacterium]|nr:ComEC/Rec2 family competence protein [Paludibacteraceae bacterium]
MSDFTKRLPFFLLLVALASGILLYHWLGFREVLFGALVCLGVVAIVLSFCFRRPEISYRFRWLFGCGFLLLIVLLGCFVTHRNETKQHFPFDGQQGVYRVEMLENPIEKPRSMLCRVRLLQRIDSVGTVSLHNKAILYLAKDSLAAQLVAGDVLLVSAAVTQPRPSGNPEAFDYSLYLRRQGFAGTSFVSAQRWQKVGHSEKFSILAMADKSRQYLLDIYKKLGIDGDEFGMLAALTLGYKDALAPELRESFSTTGAMHVLAVSGLHVGIIFVVFGFLFSFMDRWRLGKRLKPIVIIFLLWCYAFITGLSPSVLRSSVMFSCMVLSGVFGRKSNTYNNIFLSAFFLLFFNPNLLFDIGFQLSYSAVLAIVYFQPKIAGLIYVKNRWLRWAWELAAVSLAAQLGTAPFSVFYFHQFPNYFLLSNFVVIPAATLILYAAVALFVFSPVPYVNVAVAFVLKWILKIMYACIVWIEHLPYSLSIVWIDGWQLLSLYAALFAVMWWLDKKSFISFATVVCLLLIFFVVDARNRYYSARLNGVVAYNDYKATVLDIIGDEHIVLTTDSLRAELLGADFWSKNALPIPQIVGLDTISECAFVKDGKRYLVLTDNYFRYKKSAKPLEVDYLLVGKAVYPNQRLIEEFVRPKYLVTLADVSERNVQKYKLLTEKENIDFYSVGHSGAWMNGFHY